MAANVAEMRYAVNGTYGSAAYDISRFDNAAAQEEYELPREETAQQEEEWGRVRERAEAIEEAKRAQSVSIAAVLGFAVVAVLMVLMLLSYVRLAEISGNISALESDIADIQVVQTKLKVEYESVFNLTEIKTYATSVLGMTKLNDSNTTVLTIERTDKAEILTGDGTGSSGIIETAKEFISSLMEYFR